MWQNRPLYFNNNTLFNDSKCCRLVGQQITWNREKYLLDHLKRRGRGTLHWSKFWKCVQKLWFLTGNHIWHSTIRCFHENRKNPEKNGEIRIFPGNRIFSQKFFKCFRIHILCVFNYFLIQKEQLLRHLYIIFIRKSKWYIQNLIFKMDAKQCQGWIWV